MNFVYLIRLGELLYSIGGQENVRNARAYFAQSIDINKDNGINLNINLFLFFFFF